MSIRMVSGTSLSVNFDPSLLSFANIPAHPISAKISGSPLTENLFFPFPWDTTTHKYLIRGYAIKLLQSAPPLTE